MKNLKNIPVDNLIEWYHNIVELKTDEGAKVMLLGLTAQVDNRYEHYIERFTKEDIITISDSLFPKNHPQLLSCYKSEGSTLSSLKKEIRDLQDIGIKGTCQYCGIGKPKSMDHFLPISEYPEFAVLAINLIPCCKDCNEKKKSYWKEEGMRGIINFYIDNIPNAQFLFGEVHFNSNIPCVKFDLKNEEEIIDTDFYEIIKRHFKRLELLKLYNAEANDELDEMIRNFTTYIKNPDFETLKGDLIKDANQLQIQFGINYWRAIMRIALASSDEFLNYIVVKINIAEE